LNDNLLTPPLERDGAVLDDPVNHYPHAPEEGYDSDLHVPVPAHTTERRLVNRIDWRVMPFLCIMYLLAFLDRVNISNANVYGMSLPNQLNLKGNRFNNALVIFFVPYVLFEIPSNILLKRFRPHVWLSFCMFMFGLVSICQGLVHNYGGLLTTRFFLGLFETGMFPGSFYLIGMWYRRHEAQRRFTFFFASTTLAGAFGGLLASAIGKMDGMRGYRAWRWIFILEGTLTCVVAILFFFLLPDFPEEAKWLKEDERAYVRARLEADQGKNAIEHKITLRDVGRVFKDPKIIVGGFMYFGLIVPAYGYAYFSPGIIKGYGYSAIQTQLHSVPPWACAFGFSLLIAYCSDKARHRFIFVLIPTAVTITGFGMLLGIHHNLKAEYAALFLAAMGTYSALPVIVCWFQCNLATHTRRSVGSAFQIGFGNIGKCPEPSNTV
jgi:MFS family permease